MTLKAYMKTVARGLLVIHVLFLGSVLSSHADTAREVALIRQGQKLLNDGRYTQAIKKFTEAVDYCRDPFHRAVSEGYLGRSYLELTQVDKALPHLEEADKLFSTLKGDHVAHSKAANLHLWARAFMGRDRLGRALDKFAESEPILRRLMKSGTPDIRERARTEYIGLEGNRARCYIRLRKYDLARIGLKNAKRATKSSENNLQIKISLDEALLAGQLQDFEKARKLYRKALEYFEARGGETERPAILWSLGEIHEQLSEFGKAEQYYREALRLARSVRDKASEAAALDHLGVVRWRRGNYAAAHGDYKRALQLRRKLDQPRYTSIILFNMGQLYRAEAQYGEAEKLFKQALDIAGQYGYRHEEALALEGLGFLYRDLGKFEVAKGHLEAALKTFKKVKDRKAEGFTLLRLGNLYERFGMFDEALDYYSQAEKIQKNIGDRLIASHTLRDMAGIRVRKGKFEQAEKEYGEALAVREEIGAPYGELLCTMALSYIEKSKYVPVAEATEYPLSDKRRKDLSSAQKYLTRAEERIQPDEKGSLMLLTYAKGRLFSQTEPQRSIELFEKLKADAKKTGSERFLFLADVGLGQAYETLNNLPKAEGAFRSARDTAETIRDTLDPARRKTFLEGEEILGIKHVLPYNALTRVRLKQKKLEGALKGAEKARARSFADHMEESVEKSLSRTDPTLARAVSNVRKRLTQVREQLLKCQGAGGDQSQIPRLRATREKLRKELKRIKQAIQRKYPHLGQVMVSGTRSLKESGLKENEWTLSYQVDERGTIVFLTKGKEVVHATQRSITGKQLAEIVSRFTKPFEKVRRPTDLKESNPTVFAAGKKLYEELVKPVARHLPEDVNLIVIPDDVLGRVPFEMLVVEGGDGPMETDESALVPKTVKFLSERWPLTYYQSITALSLSRSRAATSDAMGEQFLIVADPQATCPLDGPLESSPEHLARLRRQARQSASGRDSASHGRGMTKLSSRACENLVSKLRPLQNTRLLADTLANEFPGQTRKYVGNEATLSVFMKKIRPELYRFGKVLFATHGIVGGQLEGVDEPAILLSMEKPGFDSWLRMSRVLNLNMNADVVFLLACQSGLGKQIAGEGTMNLGRAFQLAGARSVLMSLWEVDEAASVKLAEIFFKKLKEGMPKEEALDLARAELRSYNGGEYDHPFFWSAFILVGERQ